MVKLWLYSDERYPDYGVTDDAQLGNAEIELTEAEYIAGRKAEDDYDRWQTLLRQKEDEWRIAQDHKD